MNSYDLICIGGGPAGMIAARAARSKGLSTAIVERHQGGLGGDCTWWGCVPSKSLVEIARLVYRTGSLNELGVDSSGVDFSKVMESVRSTISAVACDDRAEAFEENGIEVIVGDATFTDEHRIEVDGEAFEAGRFVIATGAGPSLPPVPGLGSVPHLTNRNVFGLRGLPDRLIVLGGGAVGLELGQAFHRLGSHVTVVEVMSRLLPSEDEGSSACMLKLLREEGIDVRLEAEACKVERRDGEIVLSVGRGDGAYKVSGDALLVATGRKAETEALNLACAGVETERGFIHIDKRTRTSNKQIFASGDVTGSPFLSHIAAHEGVVAGSQAAGRWWMRTNYRVVPRVTFTDPEVASVGLTEVEARDRYGGSVDIATYPMARVDRARLLGDERGFIKLIAKRRRPFGSLTGGKLVGAHIVGAGAGELIHEASLAMQARVFTARLVQTIHAYPTLSAGMQQAASQFFPLARDVVPKD